MQNLGKPRMSIRDLAGCAANVAGTELVLMANRMAWWAEEKILLLADSHFGKAATFRKAGLPVPMGTTERMLQTLSAAVAALEPARLVILGDLVHSVTQAGIDFEHELFDWRRAHSGLSMTLVLGNHDRRRQRLFDELELDARLEETCGPFRFCHDPLAEPAAGKDEFLLGGHIHPGVRLGKGLERVPCFWQGENFLVFPAFGEFTGLADIATKEGDVLFPISGGEIARLAVGNRDLPP